MRRSDPAPIDALVDRVRRGTLSRRAFIGRLAALGVAAPLAQALLADAGLAQTPATPYKPKKRGGGGALRILMWQGRNRGRWANAEYDQLMRQAEVELDPVKRTAMFIRLNDIVCDDVAAIPLVYRPSVNALKRGMVASISGWDMGLSSIADWYREA